MTLSFHMVAALLLAFALSPAAAVQIMDGSHFSDHAAGNDRSRGNRVGEGPGRPLYKLNLVEMPRNTTGRQCISARMDKSTQALTVDERPHDTNSIAWACFDDEIATTGWSNLHVVTSTHDYIPLGVKAYTAGFLEGLLTKSRMTEFNQNVQDLLAMDCPTETQMQAVERVVRYAMVAWEEFAGGDASTPPDDDIPRQAWAALLQMRGLRDGHNLLAQQDGTSTLSAYDLMLMNMHAELPAIAQIYARSSQGEHLNPYTWLQTEQRQNRHRKVTLGKNHHGRNSNLAAAVAADETSFYDNAQSWQRWSDHLPKGSAMVRLTGPKDDFQDLITGHVTWGDYSEMTRVWKHYELDLGTLIKQLSLSSYPGCISSTDDYIINGRGLVAMSTSLYVAPQDLHETRQYTNNGLPAFVRSMMASRLATLPRIWAKVYGFTPGIAGSKQWILVDYSQAKAQQPIANGTVFFFESVPTVQRMKDVSVSLREDGFFVANGIPHFREIREIYGLPGLGPGSYAEHVESALVDKAETINQLSNAREILLEMEPSRGPNQLPITVRNDLQANTTGYPAIPTGGIDAKITNVCLVNSLAAQAISGPPVTTSGGSFSWTNEDGTETFPGWPRAGLPNTWNFDWVSIHPTNGIGSPLNTEESECKNGDAAA